MQSSGIDPSGDYVTYAQDNLQIDLSKAELADLPEQQRYDIISMFHVFEHLAHPRDVMEKVASLLNDGGLFVIEVPNFGSPRMPPRNTFFKAHVTYATQPALEMLASPYFTIETCQANKELFAVLRKRRAPGPRDTSKQDQAVAQMRERFQRRGMLEYLTHGGALSVFSKTREQIRTARAIRGLSPRQILDGFVTPHREGQSDRPAMQRS